MFGAHRPASLSPVEVRDALVAHRIVLIDVREPAEFGAERIHGALLFPMSTFDPQALPAGGPRPIVLHCGSGKRSATALERCRQAGVDIDRHMEGGMAAWKAAGLPVVRLDLATGAVRDTQ